MNMASGTVAITEEQFPDIGSVLDYDKELKAIKSLHEAKRKTDEDTGAHQLMYREGKRLVKVQVREFSDVERDRANAMTLPLVLFIPFYGIDEVICFVDVWMRKKALVEAAMTGDGRMRLDDRAYLGPSPKDASDRMGAILVVHGTKGGAHTRFYPYEDYEGLITWDESLVKGIGHTWAQLKIWEDENDPDRTLKLGADKELTHVIQSAFEAKQFEMSSKQAIEYVLTKGGYQIKYYE